jgi:SPP1 family predicted phage head-tail adaptor
MGDFRHWLTFEDLVVELDSDGAQVETWVPAFEVNSRMPCEVTALSGRELLAAQAIQSKITTRLKVHYRPGFKARIARGSTTLCSSMTRRSTTSRQ